MGFVSADGWVSTCVLWWSLSSYIYVGVGRYPVSVSAVKVYSVVAMYNNKLFIKFQITCCL
jgi:hypothetical protein